MLFAPGDVLEHRAEVSEFINVSALQLVDRDDQPGAVFCQSGTEFGQHGAQVGRHVWPVDVFDRHAEASRTESGDAFGSVGRIQFGEFGRCRGGEPREKT